MKALNNDIVTALLMASLRGQGQTEAGAKEFCGAENPSHEAVPAAGVLNNAALFPISFG